ncbi:MtrB/PioB family outer membrane beta-barrel protein [Tahibacter harae]|uniref:MtrB/PioB family outer membrane beta-barrel protein n=1 Tax=Tahibacter harae TaxID=2963937 RepID=A0ABT1QU65_9GAMM|nr:MtrB/PioB family outer membrane beta-barrel protein [Tahibacter harae]MCQ4165819.1 MtrB/PioB family outer membrane beta-barrel protein [Tahibacter harae]
MPRTCIPVRAPLTLALLLALPAAQADSGVGVDSWRGNKLDPSAGAASATTDARGMSWLRPDLRRSPGGHLYVCPAESPQMQPIGEWEYAGRVQLGYLITFGDDANGHWNRYVKWDSGLILGLLEIALRRPEDGSYADIRASRISDDDAFFQAAFGRAGSYKVEAFLRELPNVVSGDARSIWSGVGGNDLRLIGGLQPGRSSSAEVAAAAAAAPRRSLEVVRSKTGLGLDLYLTPQWSGYARLSEDRRRGARPFGGAFFYNFVFAQNAGVLETPRPVADSTINMNLGLRYAGSAWRLDFGYDGSFYRDRYTRFDFDNPFRIAPSQPGASAPPVERGQFATEPDNDYHNLRASLTRRLPLDGEFSLSAAAGRLRQDDDLIAPVNCQGLFGIDQDGSGQPGPANRFLYACADWNTPAALSRRSADLQIDTLLLDSRFTLQPLQRLHLRGGLRFNREDYRNTYLAYNPLTGDYGYIAENAAPGSILGGQTGIWNPFAARSILTRVRSIPLDQQEIAAHLGADWRLSERNSLGATYTFTRDEPSNRERRRIDDDSLKIAWSNRAWERLTLRASYTWLQRGGDAYDYRLYAPAYSSSLPGFVAPFGGLPAPVVEAMRKYDLSDRREHKVDLIASYALREDMTLSANLRGDFNNYAAQIGRQAYDTGGISLQWDWQPGPDTQAGAYFGYDRSRLVMANVNEEVFGPDPRLGGETFPDTARWWAYDKQRNRSAGANLVQRLGRVKLDAAWNLIDSRGITSFRFNSPLALAYFEDGAAALQGAFSPLRYRVDSLTLGFSLALTPRHSLRLFDYYERGRLQDWHYQGLQAGSVIDHRVYTDAGPQSYTANLIGLLLDIRL